MIIAFYPGAGGNRYLRMLRQLEYQTHKKIYDDTINDQTYANRYLVDNDVHRDQEIILTHCMNEFHIKKKFPTHDIVFIVGDLKKCLRREWALVGHDRYVKLDVSVDVNRLEHYNAYKDNSWPDCLTVEDLGNLPQFIRDEVDADFQKNLKISSIGSDTLSNIEKSVSTKVHSAYETICWHMNYYKNYPLEISSQSTIINLTHGLDTFSQMMRVELELYQSDIFDEVWNKVNV